MSGAQVRPTLAGYRDTITELMSAGEPFDDVEAAIDEVDHLTTEEKSALWLFALSLRDRDGLFERETPAHRGAVLRAVP